jgi:hypothetical protein
MHHAAASLPATQSSSRGAGLSSAVALGGASPIAWGAPSASKAAASKVPKKMMREETITCMDAKSCSWLQGNL